MSVLILLALAALCQGFNLEPKHSVVIEDPTGDLTSYFGYALGFWRQSSGDNITTWLLVGAPRGEVEGLKGVRVRGPGAVYKCAIGLKVSTCSPLEVLGREDRVEQDLRWRWKRTFQNIPARAWIGATIAVEQKLNGAVVVCGPRMKRWMNISLRYIPGTCYYGQSEENITSLPLIESVYPNRKSGFETGFAQVGMSAEFVKNINETQLVVGAPGVYYFRGAISVYESYNTGRPQKGLPILHMPSASHVASDSYLGYSIATARFHADGSLSYIAGAPRAKGSDFYTGAVYVVQQPHAAVWREETTLKGYQMGEYFGATVAVMDLDLDGQDDLLVVGAPLHSPPSDNDVTSAGDLGVVYVYLNKGKAQLVLLEEKLTGSSIPGSRFGSSLAVVGDLNKDGYTDLVVGAPYEDSGAVYFYHGQDQGIRTRYSQRIAASEIDHSLRGFGISISSGLDVDGNSFNDIAVGSHEASRAVLIKTYPVIDFHATLEPSSRKLNVNATKFSIKACIQYNSNAEPNINGKIEAELVLRIDTSLKRAVIQNADDFSEKQVQTRHVTLEEGVTFCWVTNATIKGNMFQVTQPIEATLEYRVIDEPSVNRDKEFCKLCPVTDPLKPTSVHVKIPFAHGCKSKTVCKADLHVDVQSSSNGQHLVLSEDTRLRLNVTVSNLGEPAYLSKLAVTLPGRNTLVKVPSSCYQHGSGESKTHEEHFICNLANPLGNKVERVSLLFDVDLSDIDLYTSLLIFNFTAWSASEELTPEDNTCIVTVPIALYSQVVIRGKTSQRSIILTSKDPTITNIIPVIHKYEVVNYGPSPVGEFLVEFEVPVALVMEEGLKPTVLLSLQDTQMTMDGHVFRCYVDYSVLNDSMVASQVNTRWAQDTLELEAVPPGMEQPGDTGQGTRRRRSLEDWSDNVTEVEDVHVRRATHLNCSELDQSDVMCVPITCMGGPLSIYSRAEVNLQMYFYRSVLESLFGNVDAAQFETFGMVDIVHKDKYTVPLDLRNKISSVETIFMGTMKGDEVARWVLPLSIALGWLLLLLLVKGLSNMGFFKRGHREKLELMREKVAAEEEFQANSD